MCVGGGLLVEKTFSGQHLCSCAFGANIRSYTEQKARHGTPFLQPPPPPSAGVHGTHTPPAEQFSGRPGIPVEEGGGRALHAHRSARGGGGIPIVPVHPAQKTGRGRSGPDKTSLTHLQHVGGGVPCGGGARHGGSMPRLPMRYRTNRRSTGPFGSRPWNMPRGMGQQHS